MWASEIKKGCTAVHFFNCKNGNRWLHVSARDTYCSCVHSALLGAGVLTCPHPALWLPQATPPVTHWPLGSNHLQLPGGHSVLCVGWWPHPGLLLMWPSDHAKLVGKRQCSPELFIHGYQHHDSAAAMQSMCGLSQLQHTVAMFDLEWGSVAHWYPAPSARMPLYQPVWATRWQWCVLWCLSKETATKAVHHSPLYCSHCAERMAVIQHHCFGQPRAVWLWGRARWLHMAGAEWSAP